MVHANIDVYAQMNSFDINIIRFCYGVLTFKTGSKNNVPRILNNVTTSASVVDVDGTNQYSLTLPTSRNMLPVTQ